MDIVYGKDRATGEYAIGPNERIRHWENEENDAEDSEQRLNNENIEETEVEQSSSTCKSRVQKDSDKKRKRVIDLFAEEMRSLKEGIKEVAKAINPRDYSEVFEYIQKIDGMSATNKMKVYQAITEDVNLVRAFVGCSEELHGLWMSTRFGDSIFDLN